MDVTGRSDQTLTLAAGQTLAGVGAINGSLVVSPGATVSPSGTNTVNGSSSTNAVGAIAAANNVTLEGTTVLKLDGVTNDLVEAAGDITYAGTLSLPNIGESPLAAGNSFKLFNAANYNGVFSTITPAAPGAGLAWSTNQLSVGVISVVSAGGPVITSTKVSSGSLIFSGTGGTPLGNYYVLTTTNLTSPWISIATNSYDAGGNFGVTNPITPGVPQEFYRIEQ
jgi:hypothetical protein